MLKKIISSVIMNKIFPMNGIWGRIYSASFWGISGSVLNRLLLFFTSVVLIRLLVTKAYGEYSIVRSTLATFVVFGSTGFGVTAMKYISEYKKASPQRAGNVIVLTCCSVAVLGAILSLFIILFAGEIAEHILHRSELTHILKWMSITIFIASMAAVGNGILSGLECFSSIMLINVLAGCIIFIFSSVFAYFWGVHGALVGLLCYFVASCILSVYFISRGMKKYGIKLEFKGTKKEIPILWRFSAPSVFNSIILSSSVWLGNSMLVQQHGGLEMMAGFDILNQGRTMLLFVPMAINNSGLSILSSLLSDNNRAEYKRAIFCYFKSNMIITLIMCLIIIIGGKFFLRLYGESFVVYYSALIVLVISGLISVIANVCGNIIQSQGKAWIGFSFNVFWSLLFLICSYFLLKNNMGVLGLCLANLLTYLLHVTLQVFYIYKFLL